MIRSMRTHVAAFLTMSATAAIGGGCLVTSDFEGIVGVRPGGEGGVGSESGVDGGDDAASSDPCATGEHLACNTFDHGEPPLPVPGWSHAVAMGSTLVIDDSSSVSAPASMRVRAGGTTGDVGAYLYRQLFIGPATALVASFDMKIISCPPQGNSFTLFYAQVASQTAFAIAILSSGAQAAGNKFGASTDIFFNLEKPVALDTWSRLVFRVERRGPTLAHFTVTVDGVKSLDTDAQTTAWQETALLNLGANGASAAQGCEVAYDNFVFDRE